MGSAFLRDISDLKYTVSLIPRAENKSRRFFSINTPESHEKKVDLAAEKVRQDAFCLAAQYKADKANRDLIMEILSIVSKDDFTGELDRLESLAGKLVPIVDEKKMILKVPAKIPEHIKANIADDVKELEKAFDAGCYRACTILCGRIMETCLHRKYFDATGVDMLEKNPGIGLGKLIAKLSDSDVSLDPGITQQIHLINQVRIHSVHVKKESFCPTRQQTHAMMLYTMDIVEKMF